MNGLIRFSLRNPHAIIVLMLSIVLIGGLCLFKTPVDILPVYRNPAVQVLTFYGGMPASNMEKDITARLERQTGQSAGRTLQESKSMVGVSIIRNYYDDTTDIASALAQVNSLATNAIPSMPPGTLPPVILPYDPTSSTPVCIVALDSKTQNESTLYDTGRYQVRNMIMSAPGANSPVVYGGKLRAVLAYLNRVKLEAHGLSPIDVMTALDRYNIFLPAGDIKAGGVDYALDSNSIIELVDRMKEIPLRTQSGNAAFLGDVAEPKDASLIQTNIVRVDGHKQVYIPVYRQQGASTLTVVDHLRETLPDMKAKLTTPDVELKLVMDQSVYVRRSIESLMWEGLLGAFLCSLVILIFLGEWRMTVIAVITIPVAVLAAITGLYATNNTINVMTLAGLALAIGPMVDSAIICLENTHRHLGLGATPKEAAFRGASEVAMPELVASCCTLLVLAPLAFMPGMGRFLFRPMALAVTFSMCTAYILSRTIVPSRCAFWLKGHAPRNPHAPIHGRDMQHRDSHENLPAPGLLSRLFETWESVVDLGIDVYIKMLGVAMRKRFLTVAIAFGLLAFVVVTIGPNLRREFFPEVDAGAFEIYARAPSGTQIEDTEKKIILVEDRVKQLLGDDLDLIISEIGGTPDWSAAFTPNSGPMDAVLKVQLKSERHKSAQQYVAQLRQAFGEDAKFSELEFGFDAGGMIRAAMNEGKSSPVNIRITSKDLEKAHKIAENIQREIRTIDGVVDCRIIQRLDYPEYVIEVDRAKAAELSLTQMDVMTNLVAALNSSIQFNKQNFWIDPKTHNQYYVGVQYNESDFHSLDDMLNIPITGLKQKTPILLRNLAHLHAIKVPAEINHTDLQPTIDLVMGIEGRDLGHVADDISRVMSRFGEPGEDGGWAPYDPTFQENKVLEGSKIKMSGEYARMQDTFQNQGIGLILASVLIYFLMVALFKSYITPLVILSAVPCGVIGVILVLWLTGTALNVQSLLGVIFMVGIVVSNTVLLTDFAQNLRREEGLSPREAIMKAAAIRVRPVCMTALATFFALVPMALGLSRGSEANTPLGRAVLGGLAAGLVTTLLVVPCLYSLLVPNTPPDDESVLPETISECPPLESQPNPAV